MRVLLYVLIAIVVVLVVLFIPFEVTLPTGEIEHETQQPQSLSSTYPEYPKLGDCEKTENRDFCLSDVAEINSDLELCEMIDDRDIRIFCIARVSLEEGMCEDILEEGLKGACLESIAMKKQWLDIE
ncbi:MAG: hypothetical protein GTN76_07815 [Candidatus Aenigmarchaeota archaeon]|nr:hypothetical protein [Candidatus Aenigmarchaeota archaeon]